MSLERKLEQELRRMWSESDTQMIMAVVDEELDVVAQRIREIFAEEYHPNVPRSWKKWKHTGLREDHIRHIEKKILGLLVEEGEKRGW